MRKRGVRREGRSKERGKISWQGKESAWIIFIAHKRWLRNIRAVGTQIYDEYTWNVAHLERGKLLTVLYSRR